MTLAENICFRCVVHCCLSLQLDLGLETKQSRSDLQLLNSNKQEEVVSEMKTFDLVTCFCSLHA